MFSCVRFMLFDERSRAYRIAAAHGLPEDVTHSVRIYPGEGIAGWVAQREQVLLLDDSVSEPALKERMKRKQLTSSLVAPLTKGSTHKPALGVLSLRTTHTDSRFTREDADFIQKLMELAQTAFLNITQEPTP